MMSLALTHKVWRGLMLLLFFSIAQGAWAQEITASGTVTDQSSGDPIIGASVAIKGTSTGTLTDVDGKFSLSVPEGALLTVSYIGYESTSLTASKQAMQIQLKASAFALDDVVVVGTRMRKSDLTGAVGNISEEQLKQVPTTDLTTAMQGKVAGLSVTRNNATPGEDIDIKVRGTNSISYGTKPVYVIDGIVAEEGIRMISPDDIASIEVLKDASSTALYGSKASNGVVVITTKKGSGKGKISYSAFATISNFQNRLKRLSATDYMNLRADAYANSYMDEHPDADRDAYIHDVLLNPANTSNQAFSSEELANGLAGRTSNWLDELTRTGLEHNHNLNFSGSDETSKYYLGLNYSNNDGVLKQSSYERMGVRFNYEKDLRTWLKIGTNTSISRANKNRLDGNAYESALMGNPLQTVGTDRLYQQYQGQSQYGWYNPILTMDLESNEVHNRVMTTNFVEVTPIKDLHVRSTFSADIYNKQDNKYTPSYIGQSDRDGLNGVGWQWRGLTEYWQWDNSISYEKTFGQHRLFALVSTSMSKTAANTNDMTGYGFPTDVLGWHNMGFASNRNRNTLGSDYYSNTLASMIARVNYTFADKYLLTATVRRDGSSRFAKGSQWGTFPSFSAAWNMEKEDFLSDVNWLDNLKIRAGFGLLGNQNIPNFAYQTIYNPSYSNGVVGFTPDDGRYGNPSLKWEKQKQYNVGVDASLFAGRFSFSADAFYMDNSDLLMKMSLWPSFGYDYQVANVARLANKGLEFSFNAKLIDGEDFKWDLSGNISHDQNKVKSLLDGVDVIWNGGNTMSRDGNLFVGQPLGTYYSFVFDKIAQQSDMDRIAGMKFYNNYIVRPGDILPKDLNGDGEIRPEDDMQVVGNSNPKFYGGFNTNFSYKAWSLNAAFTYSYGGKKADWLYERLMDGSATIGPAHIDQLDRWTPEHTNTNVPRAYHGNTYNRFGYSTTDLALLDASFLRLASMTLRYNFPSNKINPILNNLSLYTSANNLFVITPYKGFDPESGQGYPLTRSFTLGVNVSF